MLATNGYVRHFAISFSASTTGIRTPHREMNTGAPGVCQ
jgi:hypothetical protein